MSSRLSEQEMHRRLQGSPASYTIHTTLPAAYRGRDLTKACCCTAVIDGRISELWSIAQLEGFNAGFHGSLTIKVKALEQGKIVLDVSRSAEFVSPRVSHANVLSRTYGRSRRAAAWCRKRSWIEPMDVCSRSSGVGYMISTRQLTSLGSSGSIEV